MVRRNRVESNTRSSVIQGRKCLIGATVSKFAPSTKQTERQGIALISSVIAGLGHLWNENQNDVGIDGWIELVRRPGGEATGRIILVQSKATGIPFATGAPVTHVCREKDLRYWLHGNAPVILVRSHPASGEAYWVSVKDYFALYPDRRASRKIIFDREKDRFDGGSDSLLWKQARPRLDGLHLGPPPVDEVLVGNLLPITRLPEVFYVAPAAVKSYREARRILREARAASLRAWVLDSETVVSFHDPAATSLELLTAGPAETIGTEEWSESDDGATQRHFVQLLNGALEEQIWPAARRGKDGDVLFLQAPDDLSNVELPGRARQTRTVVKTYRKDGGAIRFVRHLAFERRFRRFGRRWYLEILPTYFYSFDGRSESRFGGKQLAGIKRIERHNDVRRHVETWSWILRGVVDLGGLAPDPTRRFIDFGPQCEVEIESGAETELSLPEVEEAA